MASRRPSEARKQYLNGLPKEKRAETVLQAEERGPGPNDVDWLIAQAASDAEKGIGTAAAGAVERIAAEASRVEAAAARVEEMIAVGGLGAQARAAIEGVAADVKTLVAGSAGPCALPSASSPWRWPKVLAALAVALLLLVAVSLSSSVATRQQDLAIARELSTPAGIAALELVRANPDLDAILARCPREIDSGRRVMTCRLWPLGTPAPTIHQAWIGTALAVVAGWSSLWLAAALALALVAIAILGWIKRGPAMKRIA